MVATEVGLAIIIRTKTASPEATLAGGEMSGKKGNAKECSNYHTIALISHASKVMLKILQARLHSAVREL